MRLRTVKLAALLPAAYLMVTACSKPQPNEHQQTVTASNQTALPAQLTPPADDRPVVVAFGDSLSAGFGAPAGQSYPDFLQQEIDAAGYRYRVVNQGISGDTTSGGVSRIGEATMLKPEIVLLELGGNDGLRGLPLETTRQNLAGMIDQSQAAGAKVLLAGMTLPRNYGPDYIRGFERIYQELAREKRTALIPFLLEGVATRPELMQRDAIHPTAEGNRIVAATVFKHLRPLFKKTP
ncbi:MAG TPA: arylesterase [Bryobacteraceae bacterium]|nr:arylesterase [Bryobacteraceae bacterium]HPT26999.1 arylesterase [Bryobacteraceae bacterium]